MAQGNNICVAGEPRGVEVRGTVSGTPLPGMAMQIKPATALIDGQPTYQAASLTFDGQPEELIIADGDWYQGKIATQAYVDATPFFGFVPLVGERVNFLVLASSGAVAIGQRYMIQASSGKFIKLPTQVADYSTGGLDAEAEVIAAINLNRRRGVFKALEAASDPSADTLIFGECIANC